MFQNGILNSLGGLQNFQRNLQYFKQQMDQSGNTNYQQMVQQLIESGRMSQEQFNQFREVANLITGKRF